MRTFAVCCGPGGPARGVGNRLILVFLEKLNLTFVRLHTQIYSKLVLISLTLSAWTPSPPETVAAVYVPALPSDGLSGVGVAL